MYKLQVGSVAQCPAGFRPNWNLFQFIIYMAYRGELGF